MTHETVAMTDREALDLLQRGFQVSCMLRAVANVGLADAIPIMGSTPIAELARSCKIQPAPLLRIIRALATFGIFRLVTDDIVEHTSRSRLLRTDARNSMHHGARFWTCSGSWGAWGKLEVALQGEVPHEAAWNTDRFHYLREHPDEMALFDVMMANFPDDRHEAIANAYPFENFHTIADIGGGNGATLRQILSTVKSTRAILFDQTDLVDRLEPADLLDGRIKAVSGSFFDYAPSGADLYLLVRVLHDWSDPDCLCILRTCREAMAKDAILLIGEHLVEPNPAQGRSADYLTDVHMMAMFGSARQRNDQELRSLLNESGFNLRRTIPTAASVSLLEAVLA